MKLGKNKQIILYLIIIFLWGLSPLLWFKDGMIISSEDMRMPLTIKQFLLNFYSWNSLFGTGMNCNVSFTGLVFFAFQALLRLLEFSTISIQKIYFVFWFMLPGFSMFFMMTRFLKSKAKYIATLAAVGFYMFNLYLEPVWVGFNVANIALYAALPFILAVYLKGLEREISFLKASVLIGLASLFASVAGANPPLVLAVIPIIPIGVLICLIRNKILFQPQKIKPYLGYLVLIAVSVFLINAFWILPRICEVLYSASGSGFSFLSKEDAMQWLSGSSANSSFYNVVRLQGIWTWYQGWKEPYCPYAAVFRNNFLFIFLSWILPALVLMGIITNKNRNRTFFAAAALFGLVFGMGIHPPFGGLYLWCVKYIPFFWIIRSPWYKFTLLTCIGYAFFIGAAAESLYRYIDNKKWRMKNLSKRGAVIGIIIVNMVYAYPILLGKIFVAPEEREFLPPNHSIIPDYVLEFTEWVNNKEDYFRTINLPSKKYWAYKWGLSSSTPLISQISLKPALFNFYSAVTASSGNKIAEAFYDTVYNKGFPAVKLLNILNVKYIVQENDLRYEMPNGGTDSPEFIKERLGRQEGIKLERKFGEWDVYKADVSLPHIYVKDKAVLIMGGIDALPALSNTKILDEPALIFEPQQEKGVVQALLERGTIEEVVFYNYDFVDGDKVIDKVKTDNLKFHILLDSAGMDTSFVTNSQAGKEKEIEAVYGEGFYGGPEAIDGQGNWYLLKENNKNHIIIKNLTDKAQKVNLSFRAYAFGRDRNLYVYLNGEFINFFPVPKGEKKQIILKDTALLAGENIVSFGNVSAADIYEQKLATFAIEDNIDSGKFSFGETVCFPENDNYMIKVYLYPLENYYNAPQICRVSVDEKIVELNKTTQGSASVYEGEISLTAGYHEIKMMQASSSENYIVAIYPDKQNDFQQPIQRPKHVEINPVKYEVSIYADKPHFLIFNESYHSQWQAASSMYGVLDNHIMINGYANGWYIDNAGEQKIIIKYKPQRLFVIGSIISVGTFFVYLILLVIMFVSVRCCGPKSKITNAALKKDEKWKT